MKKFRKILSIVSATVICALPMINGISASAATVNNFDTYRFYFDVNANSGVAVCSMTFKYSAGAIKAGGDPFKVGNLGDSLHSGGGREFGTAYYKNDNGNIYDAGTLFTLTIGTEGYVWNHLTSFKFSVMDENNNTLNQSLVKVSTVLVGDSNDDGKVDNNDVTAIYNYLTNPGLYPLNSYRGADTNRDGIVDFTDAVNIYNYLNGELEGFYKL